MKSTSSRNHKSVTITLVKFFIIPDIYGKEQAAPKAERERQMKEKKPDVKQTTGCFLEKAKSKKRKKKNKVDLHSFSLFMLSKVSDTVGVS